MTEDDETPQPAIDLGEALKQMDEGGNRPDGFHMMFFSPEFSIKEECPVNILLKKIALSFDCADTLKRQVYQMPKGGNIYSYEFAWFGDFHDLQDAMEAVDTLINDGFKQMLDDGVLTEPPKARVQFLKEAPDSPEDDIF